MTSSNEDQIDEIICSCTGTTESKIKQLIEDGAETLDQISDATGVTTGCGACDVSILEMLNN